MTPPKDETDDAVVWESLIASDDDFAAVLISLANKKRLQLLAALLKGERSFQELQETVGLGKTALSHHLGLLVDSGVARRRSRGSYELSDDGLEYLGAIADAFASSVRRRKREAARRAEYILSMYRRREGMDEMKVEIGRLEPMRVVAFHAMSENPEEDAAKMLVAWAQPRGLLEDPEEHSVYGFNNPDPKPGDIVRGYEFWIRVEPGFEAEDAVVKDYSGGLFAVARVHVKEPWNDIPPAWMRLVEWVAASEYELDPRVCLEKTLDVQSEGEFILDLYCPLKG
jgi:DNA gyrase inhibitor GyrI/DNA-binding HxlR family transcriptional regulator